MATLLAYSFARALVLTLLLAGTGRAQAPTVAPAVATHPVSADVILRLDGEEVVGRVLLISPTELRYLPPAGGPAASARPDTLRLPVTEVFLVRFANGTHQVLNRPAVAEAAQPGDRRLAGLSDERQQRGLADARQHYRGNKVFWGTAGLTGYLGPVLGLAPVALIVNRPVAPRNLLVPAPTLLQDPDYDLAYRNEAQQRKRRSTWGGYATGVGVHIALIGLVLASWANGY